MATSDISKRLGIPAEDRQTSPMSWRPIEPADIPTHKEFERLTLEMLRAGMSNSDRMRDRICRDKQLILQRATGRWNSLPSGKFVNEHAWVLEDLVLRGLIKNTGVEKKYTLVG